MRKDEKKEKPDSNLHPLNQADVFSKVYDYWENGGKPGLQLGFKCLDELYTHKHDGVTDWTGKPGSGKTYFVLECLINLSNRYGHRHGLYVPDIGSEVDVIAKLVKMHSGKDMNDKYNNKVTADVLASSMDWIFHHFVIFKKKDFKQGVTPLAFWETICGYKDDGGTLNTGLIDSWKNMKHLYSGREDQYLDEVLSIRNELAEQNNKHFHTIAHASKTETEAGNKRRIPTGEDIKGGGSWNANGKNIITVDFPDKTRNQVDIYVSKVKPEDVGHVGSIIGKLFLDKKRGRYYEVMPPHNLFAFDHEKGFNVVDGDLPF